jgi:hypothetical protein
MKTEPNDADVLTAVMNAFGHTPDTVEGKAAQINLALSAGDSVMAGRRRLRSGQRLPGPQDDARSSRR